MARNKRTIRKTEKAKQSQQRSTNNKRKADISSQPSKAAKMVCVSSVTRSPVTPKTQNKAAGKIGGKRSREKESRDLSHYGTDTVADNIEHHNDGNVKSRDSGKGPINTSSTVPTARLSIGNVEVRDPSLPAIPAPPYTKGNGAYKLTTSMYIVSLLHIFIERKVRGNVQHGHELRFNASELSRGVLETDGHCSLIIGDTASAVTKLQRFIRNLQKEHSKWLRGDLPASASVKSPDTIRDKQIAMAKKATKGTTLSMKEYDEYMDRIGIVVAEMGSYRQSFGAASVGTGRIEIDKAPRDSTKRVPTYDVDEGVNTFDDELCSLERVQSDSEDDEHSPSVAKKDKDGATGEEKIEECVAITPRKLDEMFELSNEGAFEKEKKGHVTWKKQAVLVPVGKGNANLKADAAEGGLRGAASGRTKREVKKAQPLSDLERFIEVIGESSRAQNEREKHRMSMDLKRVSEAKMLRRLEALQKLVDSNPGNETYEKMLESYATKMFCLDEDTNV